MQRLAIPLVTASTVTAVETALDDHLLIVRTAPAP